MVMARANDFFNLVIIALLALVVLPAGYYYLGLFLKEYYKPILIAVFIFSLIDLFILGPRREEDAREHGEERLKKLKQRGKKP
ncbi:MAG: hypothetical protein WC619_05950 [Patescibacteria group bacterium]